MKIWPQIVDDDDVALLFEHTLAGHVRVARGVAGGRSIGWVRMAQPIVCAPFSSAGRCVSVVTSQAGGSKVRPSTRSPSRWASTAHFPSVSVQVARACAFTTAAQHPSALAPSPLAQANRIGSNNNINCGGSGCGSEGFFSNGGAGPRGVARTSLVPIASSAPLPYPSSEETGPSTTVLQSPTLLDEDHNTATAADASKKSTTAFNSAAPAVKRVVLAMAVFLLVKLCFYMQGVTGSLLLLQWDTSAAAASLMVFVPSSIEGIPPVVNSARRFLFGSGAGRAVNYRFSLTNTLAALATTISAFVAVVALHPGYQKLGGGFSAALAAAWGGLLSSTVTALVDQSTVSLQCVSLLLFMYHLFAGFRFIFEAAGKFLFARAPITTSAAQMEPPHESLSETRGDVSNNRIINAEKSSADESDLTGGIVTAEYLDTDEDNENLDDRLTGKIRQHKVDLDEPGPPSHVEFAAESDAYLDALMHVYVTTPSGRKLSLDVKPSATVATFKAMIENSVVPISPDMQRLVFEGRIIDDNQTLADYNIMQGADIQLITMAWICVKLGHFTGGFFTPKKRQTPLWLKVAISEDNVLSVKKTIEDLESLPSDLQDLRLKGHPGTIFRNEHTLGYYNVRDNSELFLENHKPRQLPE